MYVSDTSTRFSRGMSIPAMRAIGYPCRCLCLGLVQMTITVPWRRITLQLSQRALTDALTFTIPRISWSPEPVCDPAPGEVVGRQLHPDTVAGQNPDEIHPQLAADVGENPVAVLELDREHRVGKRLDHRSFHFDRVLLGHRR